MRFFFRILRHLSSTWYITKFFAGIEFSALSAKYFNSELNDLRLEPHVTELSAHRNSPMERKICLQKVQCISCRRDTRNWNSKSGCNAKPLSIAISSIYHGLRFLGNGLNAGLSC